VPLLVSEGIAAIGWEMTGTLLLLPGMSVVLLSATWLTLRSNYKKNSALRDGIIYRLDEQGIIRENNIP
jgi:hypothetical protein